MLNILVKEVSISANIRFSSDKRPWYSIFGTRNRSPISTNVVAVVEVVVVRFSKY